VTLRTLTTAYLPTGKSSSAPVSLIPAVFIVGDDDDADDKRPLGGNLGSFPPSLTATPPLLLLQNPSGKGLAVVLLGLSLL